MMIRPAISQDYAAIQRIYQTAFPANECELVAPLALNLLVAETTPPSLSFVAEVKQTVVGHIAFSPVILSHDSRVQAYILAPLAVAANAQKQGIGTKLVEYGKQVLADLGVEMLFVYGDPSYYGKFGFSVAFAAHYQPVYTLEYPFGWQALALNDSSHTETSTQASTFTATVTCVEALCDQRFW